MVSPVHGIMPLSGRKSTYPSCSDSPSQLYPDGGLTEAETHLGNAPELFKQTEPPLSRHNDLAQAMDYMLKRWGAFTRFLHDGRICLTNNAAERMLRGAALGRKAWLFAGSDQGGERAAAMYSLIQTAKLNGVDPRAWLADVLARIADMPQQRLHELLPWNWKMQQNMTHSTA